MNVTVLIFGIAFLAGSAILVLGWELSGRWAFLSSRAQRRLHLGGAVPATRSPRRRQPTPAQAPAGL